MVNSWLRPSDIKSLQNKHIEIVKQKGGTQFLRIRPTTSKTVNTPVVTMAAAVGIYEDITKYNKKFGFGNADDYVFYPRLKNRDFALQTMRRQFDHCLIIANLKHSAAVPRTLYSLRHTAAMLTLTLGDSIDLLTLARNMRSLVSMLERFYVSHLSAEMNVEKLQSRRKRIQ
jgi:integrase